MASSDRVVQFLRKEDGSLDYKKLANMVLLGGAYGAVAYQALRSDLGDDKAKALSSDALTKNFAIPNGTDKPYQIPMGLGLPRLMLGAGVLAARWVAGHISTKQAAEAYKNTLMENLSPLHPIQPMEGADFNTQVEDLFTALIPSIPRPGAELALNQDAFGNPIYTGADQRGNKFKSDSGRLTTPQTWKDLAKGVRELGGPDMPPEFFPYVIKGYGGGALSMFVRAMKLNQEEELGHTPTMLEKYAPQLENRDIEFAGNKQFYQARDVLRNADKEKSAIQEAWADKHPGSDKKDAPIPPQLQRQLDVEKEFTKAATEHSKEMKAVLENRLLSQETRASRLATLNTRWQQVQQRLSQEAERLSGR
jgi:hypothetical protein